MNTLWAEIGERKKSRTRKGEKDRKIDSESLLTLWTMWAEIRKKEKIEKDRGLTLVIFTLEGTCVNDVKNVRVNSSTVYTWGLRSKDL